MPTPPTPPNAPASPAPATRTLTFHPRDHAKGAVALAAYRQLRMALQSIATRPADAADLAEWTAMASVLDQFAALEAPPPAHHPGGEYYVGPLRPEGGAVALTPAAEALLWEAWDAHRATLSRAFAREVVFVEALRAAAPVAG